MYRGFSSILYLTCGGLARFPEAWRIENSIFGPVKINIPPFLVEYSMLAPSVVNISHNIHHQANHITLLAYARR